jgi:hypothetical protein
LSQIGRKIEMMRVCFWLTGELETAGVGVKGVISRDSGERESSQISGARRGEGEEGRERASEREQRTQRERER